MSESVSTGGAGAGSGASQGSGAQTSAAQTSGAGQSQPQTQSGGSFTQNAQAPKQGADTGRDASEADNTNAGADDFEEIALGATKGKVPKAIAKAIKDYERGIQAKFSEAAQARKQAEHIMNLAKTNQDEFAKMVGIDLDAISVDRLAKKYELQQMNDDQRRAYEAEQKLAEHKKMDLQSKRQLLDEIRDLTGETVDDDLASSISKERIMEYLQGKKNEYSQTQNAIESEVLGAWKETGLPADPMFGQWVAAMMLNHQKARNAGKIEGEPLQAKDAAVKVKQKLTNSMRGMFSQMAPEAIQEFLGKEIVQKLRDFDIDRVNRQNDPLLNKQNSPGQQPASSPKKQMNQLEWRKHMGLG